MPFNAWGFTKVVLSVALLISQTATAADNRSSSWEPVPGMTLSGALYAKGGLNRMLSTDAIELPSGPANIVYTVSDIGSKRIFYRCTTYMDKMGRDIGETCDVLKGH